MNDIMSGANTVKSNISHHGNSDITPSNNQYLLLVMYPIYIKPSPLIKVKKEGITHIDLVIMSIIFIFSPYCK